MATESKSAIEDDQRRRVKEREEKGETWTPRFFVAKGDKYFPKIECVCSVLPRMTVPLRLTTRCPPAPALCPRRCDQTSWPSTLRRCDARR